MQLGLIHDSLSCISRAANRKITATLGTDAMCVASHANKQYSKVDNKTKKIILRERRKKEKITD